MDLMAREYRTGWLVQRANAHVHWLKLLFLPIYFCCRRCCGTRIRVEMSSGRSRRDDRKRSGGGGSGGGGGGPGGGRNRYRYVEFSASIQCNQTRGLLCSVILFEREKKKKTKWWPLAISPSQSISFRVDLFIVIKMYCSREKNNKLTVCIHDI